MVVEATVAPPITTLGGQMMAVSNFVSASSIAQAQLFAPMVNAVADARGLSTFARLERDAIGGLALADFRGRVVPAVLGAFRPAFNADLIILPECINNPTIVWRGGNLGGVNWWDVQTNGVVTQGAVNVFAWAMLERVESERGENMKALRDLPGMPRASNLWIYSGAIFGGSLGYWLGGDSLVSICALTLLLGTGFALFGRDIRDGRTERALNALDSETISDPQAREAHGRLVELLRIRDIIRTARMLLDPPIPRLLRLH